MAATDVDIPALTLYYKPGASSIAAHMLLRELDLPFDGVAMSESQDGSYEGAQGSALSHAAFLRLNPMGYVPTLVVDGVVLTELSAILTFIASLRPETRSLGSTPLEHAKVVEWMSWLSTNLNECGFAGYRRRSRILRHNASKEAMDAARSHGRQTFLTCFPMTEDKIHGEGRSVGDNTTVVDMMLHTFYRWGTGDFDMSPYPKFRQVAVKLEEWENIQAALACEGLALQFPKKRTHGKKLSGFTTTERPSVIAEL